jgi:hypothetical protein
MKNIIAAAILLPALAAAQAVSISHPFIHSSVCTKLIHSLLNAQIINTPPAIVQCQPVGASPSSYMA